MKNNKKKKELSSNKKAPKQKVKKTKVKSKINQPKTRKIEKKKIKVKPVKQPAQPDSIAKKLSQIKRPVATTTVRNYLSKKELLASVMESKELGKMSDSLAFKLTLLVTKYAKSAQFNRYTYNDDMQAYALMMLVRTWNTFNPEKSDNPFAYYTQCIKNSFVQFLNQEKRQRNIKDELFIEQGLSPSYNYQGDTTTNDVSVTENVIEHDPVKNVNHYDYDESHDHDN